MLNPVAMSIIRNVFDDPRERAQAIGLWGAMMGISMALGPILGGALVDSVGWHSVFLVNVPVGVLAIVLTAAFVPESRAPRPRRLDPGGQVLVIAALASLTYAIIEGNRLGWTSPAIIGLFCFSLLSLAALVGYELRRDEPLLEMRFFASAPFSGASAIAICAFAALGGFLFLNTLYLQNVRGAVAVSRGALHAADGRSDAGVRAAVGADRRPAAVASTSRQVGATLGVAVVGAVAGGGLSGVIGPGFATATHPSWWIVVGLSLVIPVVSLLTTTAWAQNTAAQTAARFREGPARPRIAENYG
jgi:predicted MFS family arabinose efflux permease